MTFTSDIHNPLAINVRRQLRVLLSKIPPSSPYATTLLNTSSNGELLAKLSGLLAVPALTLPVVITFRPVLLDLCARWLHHAENTEEQLVALSLLLEPHEELFPVLHNMLLKPGFERGPLAFITTSPSILSIDVPRMHRLLLAYYRILQANRELPNHLLWPLSPLSMLIWTPHLDNGVRLLSIRCYALQSGMGEAEREKLEIEVLGEICGVDCQLEYGENADGSRKEVDGWIMPVVELRRIKDARNVIVLEPLDYYAVEEDEGFQLIHPSELSPLTANVHGILLFRSPGPHEAASPLIQTPTAIEALRSLALHISLRLPTLLTSPPSSGKSLLLSHLATILFPGVKNQIVNIHLADTSLDPRSLLGSYVSSPTQPGTFEWKEGVLVRSMREGKWIVFEDIDRGSSEVLGVIKPLVESLRLGKWIGGRASLEVPSRGRVVAHDAFLLFATRSTLPSRTGKFPNAVFFGAHKFHEVTIPSPSSEELWTIVVSRFPRLTGVAAHSIIRLWESIRALGSAASTRNIGLRELEKFCVRIDNLLPASYQFMDLVSEIGATASLSAILPNPTLREDLYLEARDVFFGAAMLTAPARAHVEAIAATVAEHLGLEEERREWILNSRIPEFDIESDVNGRAMAVRVGRTRLLARSTKVEIVPPITRPFAMHRPAVLLLSRIATAVSLGEPVLLSGETGTGKTSIVTHLASLLRRPLISLNLSHQTESSDLLGGFKPVDARVPGSALQERFLELFGGTFSRRKNAKFEESVRKAIGEGKWKRAVGLWKESIRLAKERIVAKQNEGTTHEANLIPDAEVPRKRRKVDQSSLNVSEASWNIFERDVGEFEVQHVHGKGKFAFSFVEGPLVKALRSGNWVLLDEINLASPETLECISGLLHGPTTSITLTEQGSLEPVPRHADFRLFACMNPATDVGKKDLPPNIRSRFTEIDVPPPDTDRDTLLSIVTQYIGPSAVGDKAAIMNVAEFYSAVKQLAERRELADGSNHRPHYSMRTLARALTFAADMAPMYSLRRSLWEGCLMAFTMVLDAPSAEVVTTLTQKYLLAGVRNPQSMLSKEPSVPRGRSSEEFVKFGPFYLEKGPLPEDPMEDYITTPSVETKLIDLARIIVTRRFPVLIEGPTSSGKTSSVEYLARRTGHRFVRINNHEHTDIQEYLGSYVSDPMTGKLSFKDGLLVRALRNGDWIVLDELNLAPTDVLEALNRLLDDNRELVIPETQEVVQPHPHFMLFATQNPPGLYAGRKILSRAFRNRFLEVHFADVPQAELESILCQRCRIAPSYGKRIVSVFQELQKRRQSSRVFESKHGFATLRDLFRWAGRDAIGYQELAENGYMLLAERTRRADDKAAVKEVIESVMGVKIDEHTIYSLQDTSVGVESFLGCPMPVSSQLIWTSAMQRLFILVGRALRFNEPVLLVGETGSGKTSVCQMYADASSKHLHGLSCHQNTETADLIGGLRPMRNRSAKQAEVFREVAAALEEIGITDVALSAESLASSLDNALKCSTNLTSPSRSHLEDVRRKLLRLRSIFEWRDGPLVESMRNGDVFLLDEISLADDSVLERLNSVLEPTRTIVLAERGGDDLEHPAIQAVDGFKLIATMNPGGDYGKKELSPALRNRFTEIWVPSVDDRHDLELIVGSLWKYDALKSYTACVLDFTEWLSTRVADRSLMSLRDILAWVVFSNSAYHPDDQEKMPTNEIFHHAAHMTFLDGLGSLPQLASYSQDALRQLKEEALSMLQVIVPLPDPTSFTFVPIHDPATFVQLGSFAIPKGRRKPDQQAFNLQAPTTRDNAMRVIRACQVPKPILLEGSPGVGKTSLIAALANISGHHLCRINLSDQTDLVDLFGSDLPVEGGGPGEFAWKDAEFLKALQEGHWVLLDEMNLAPQAILEGLNAVLDHRGTIYIPELGRTFTRHPSFRIFAAQNPLNQGGGRKGLPKSFVNRFTKVYVEELSPNDLLLVCQHLFPDSDMDIFRTMVSFNTHLNEEIVKKRAFAREGGPWEFNLRDVIRWGTLLSSSSTPHHPVEHLCSLYLHRFRNLSDRYQARLLFDKVFSTSTGHLDQMPHPAISASYLQIGHFRMQRTNLASLARPGRILKRQLSALESVGHCITQSWLAILTGPHDCGKTDLVRVLANLTGNRLDDISVNSATDTMDILGSFEQVDTRGRVFILVEQVLSLVHRYLRSMPGSKFRQDERYDILQRALRVTMHSNSCSSVLHTASSLLGDLDLQDDDFIDQVSVIQSKIGDLLTVRDTAGRFEWVDGPLVRAIKQGHWLLMDGANLCNPSVLDRLNSLCEPGGVLTLSERGYVNGEVQVVRPHANFRLFMSVDPLHGELSRAMRNRGVEIALITNPASNDEEELDHLRLPVFTSPLHTRCLEFDAARRGIFVRDVERLEAASSSGRALDQDSALSSLIDHAPMLVISSCTLIGATDSLLYFFARTATPAYASHFSRFVATLQTTPDSNLSRIQAFLHAFPGRQLGTKIAHLREEYSRSRGVPPAFVFAQPMDFYMNCLPCHDGKLELHCPSAHLIIFQALELAVALFLDEENSKTMKSTASKRFENLDRNQRAMEHVELVLSATQAAGYTTLESLNSVDGLAKSEDLRLAFKLLGYTQRLRKALSKASFDYSTVQAISKWISDALEECPTYLMPLATHARALCEAVSLSSGLGLMEIWSTFLIDRPLKTSSTELSQLEALARNLKPSGSRCGLRRQAFELMTLRTLPVFPDDQDAAILETLYQQLERRLFENRLENDMEGSYRIEPSILIAELGVLAIGGGIGGASVSETSVRCMKQIIELACQDIHSPLLRLVSYQHLIWATSEKRGTLPITAQLQMQWLNAVWTVPTSDHMLDGPSVLLHPAQLHATITICDWSRNSLSSLKDYEESIRRQLRLMLLNCEQDMSRTQQLVALLQQSVAMLSHCFPSSFNETTHEKIRNLMSDLPLGGPVSMYQLLSFLEQTDNVPLGRALRRFLRPAFQRFLDQSHTRQRSIAAIGLCWIAISRLFLDLYVPDTPIDPAAIQNCALEFWRQQEAIILSQISLHSHLERVTTGNSNNNVIAYLAAHLGEVSAHLSSISVLPVRHDVSRLHMFWSEVSQFQNHVTSPSKIDGLVLLLQAGDETAVVREQVMQQSMAGFCQRLDAVYAEYADISTPLQLAILYMRLGLRLLAHSTACGSDTISDPLARVSTALVAFPSVLGSTILRAEPTPTVHSGVTAFRQLMLTLSAIAMERSLGVGIETEIHRVETTYSQVLRLWLIDRAKEVEANEASRSLYRHKELDYDAVGEAELEEQEFLSLFPSFEDVLEQEGHAQLEFKPQHSFLVDPTDMPQFIDIHHSLFTPSRTLDSSSAFMTFTSVRRAALGSLLQSQMVSLPDTLDNVSVQHQLTLLNDRLSGLQCAPKFTDRAYNFYTDSNVLEMTKAATVVLALKRRLGDLVQEWPDQMVLQHLMSRCDAVLDLDLHSPIAKILSALEQLLVQSEDWEIYANRENNLKAHQQALTGLIVEWRRLELSCWQALLESQAKSFADGAVEWWFRLYDATIRGPLDASDREQQDSGNLTDYLDILIPLLNDFIGSSPLGQFDARMKFLQSFEIYSTHLALYKYGSQRLALERVRAVLHATRKYYSLFSTQISTHLSEQRILLEKEILGFIKLASWKDTNVHALKQSAQRTHHQLYKIIRKFRDIMRQPILERLRPQFASDSECRCLNADPAATDHVTLPESPSFPNADLTVTPPDHLINIERTFRKFDALVTGRIRAFVKSRPAHIVDNFAVDIIVTAKELAAATISRTIPTDRREKEQKALLVRKRKAWSDLLKELKRGGFAVNIKPDVLRQQTNTRYIREQPIMPSVAKPSLSAEKSENYFNRVHGSLPELRSSLSDHHADLTTRELQRGVTLLESGFTMALDARSLLAQALNSYDKLEQMSRRLRMMASASKIVLSDPKLAERISHINDTMSRLAGALDEIAHGLDTFNELHPEPRIPTSFLDQSKALTVSTKALCDRLAMVLNNVRLAPLSFLLESEHALVLEVFQHLAQTTQTLHRWSDEQPRLKHIFYPVRRWLEPPEALTLLSSNVGLTPIGGNADPVIDALLVNVQTMLLKCANSANEDLENERDHYIRDDYHTVRNFTQLLNIDRVLQHLESALQLLASQEIKLQRSVQRFLPFLEVYLNLVEDQLAIHTHWTGALFKLIFVLCSVMHTIAKQGFCKPSDADETGAGGDASEAVGGLGLGEGSGTENVTKDIEDESQVEGLQGDATEGNESKEKNGDDDAIEMSEDFGGNMEDVPDSESQDDQHSEQESQVDPEERLGNLDRSDPSAVDEKLWGDEQGPQDVNDDEKTNQDHAKEKGGQSDVVAKEENQRQAKQKSADKEDDEEMPPNAEDESMPEDDIDNDRGEETPPNASGAPMDEYVPDANTLDLPDDMDLGPGEEMPEDMNAESEGDPMEDEPPEPSSDNPNNERDNGEQPDDAQELINEGEETEDPRRVQEMGDHDNDCEDSSEEHAIAQPDVSTGEGATASNEPHNPDGGENATADQAGSSEGVAGQVVEAEGKTNDKDGPPESNQPQLESQSTDLQTAGSSAAGPQQGQAPTQPDLQLSSNPLRSLGDVLKEIQHRSNEILHAEQTDINRKHPNDTAESNHVEYLPREDFDYDMQALGPAGEEQVAKLKELKLVEGDNQDNEAAPPMDMDLPLHSELYEQNQPRHANSTEHDLQDTLEGAISKIVRPASDHLAALPDISGAKTDVEMQDDGNDGNVEAELRHWQALGLPDDGAEHIWRLYESLTHDLAYALCEQLRLILEPTLATRLKGDYRTGKRLNMKKIIPYIASDYTKDKIWLRRTRPSQREYQVLIALDDSRSMAESHSIHLAYETLALVSKALSRLEAGDIGIAKFGETVDILHGFDEGPFTDQAGTKVMNAFRFNQKATNVLSLVETSLKVLDITRERRSINSASASDLWQLEIIISDGMCQDHDRLRTVLRKAEEQRVMIVFIIVDSLHSAAATSGGGDTSFAGQRGFAQTSILSMEKAEFKNINGRMELQLERYLDSFPFEYYVVLRNVEALPEVLSTTLKQFFERVSEE